MVLGVGKGVLLERCPQFRGRGVPLFKSLCHISADIPIPTLPTVTKSFDDAAEMSSVNNLLRKHKPRPSNPGPGPLPKRSNSIGIQNMYIHRCNFRFFSR